MSLEHLDWSLSHVEVWSTTLTWNKYYVQGEIGYTADLVRVRADWKYTCSAGIRMKKMVSLELTFL